MESAKTYATQSLEILVSQNKKINNIEKSNENIVNNLSYSKYIIDTFNIFRTGSFKNKTKQSENNKNNKNNISENNKNNIYSIITINKQINTLLENQNKTLTEIKYNTNNNNKLIKTINSHHLF